MRSCYSPTTVWVRHNSVDKRFYFRKPPHFDTVSKEVPCGRCINCRLRRARDWATRIAMEARLYTPDLSWFTTLTYDRASLPDNGSLVNMELTWFMERLRWRVGHPVRFIGCAEYGGQTYRPHYHAILFGLELHDLDGGLREVEASPSGVRQFTHQLLDEVWGKGIVKISAFGPGAASYVGGYVVKKLGGAHLEQSLVRERIDPVTGVVTSYSLLPPYMRMSRRPGIGHGYFEKYPGSLYPSGFVILGDRNNVIKAPVPAYFGKQLWQADKDRHSDHFEAAEQKALDHQRSHPLEYTDARRLTHREIAELREARTTRKL